MNNVATVIVVLLFIAVGAGVGFYYQYYEPVTVEREEIQNKIEEHKNEKEKLKGLEKEIKDYKKKIEEATAEKAKLQTDSIPLNTVVPKLLESTEAVANKFKVKFSDIRISPLVRAEDWSELPVELTILGTFNNVNCFLNVMEQRKIINLAAGSMNVSVSAEVDKETESPLLSVTLSAKVYIL